MIATIFRETSKFQKACEEAIRRAEEYEKVYPITYKCLKCKDKKGFLHIGEDGNEYWEDCICSTWKDDEEEIPI